MPSIDERIIAMSFENQVFEARVAQTMITLSKLDTAIKNLGSGSNGFAKLEAQANKVTLQGPMSAVEKMGTRFGHSGAQASQSLSEIERASQRVTLEGPSRAVDQLRNKMGQFSSGTTFTDIEKAADRTTLSGLTNSLDNVTAKFSVLKGAASVALGNIAAQAAMRGGAFAKSFAFQPIQQGMQEYQTNLGSIQTILSNTQGQQVTGLGNVQKYLGQLNTYSDKTIYNFSEMAKNIGTFTAAGVDLPRATESIKGIANLAAASGSSSQQASTAMYQLSQAIASGKVGLQDWNSVVNAGMGGALFQKALMRTASNMGTVEKGAVQIDKATGKATVNGESFRDSIMAKPGQKSWLTSDVLTKTLQQFTGDLSDAQLKAQGFTDAQIKSIQATAKTAQDAATQVKTLPQVFDVAKETIGSGWAKTFQLIFGDFNQSKKTFTELSNWINGFINKTSKARNDLLQGFNKLGGREKVIDALKTAFRALTEALKPIGQAFREVFPATTPKGLIGLVDGFKRLASNVGEFFRSHGAQLKDIFAGIFSVFHIGWTLTKALVGAIGHLLGVVAGGSGGFLGFVAAIGRFITSIDKATANGHLFEGILKGVGSVLRVPIELIKAMAKALFGLFSGASTGTSKGVSASLNGMHKALGPLAGAMDFVVKAFNKFMNIVGKIKDFLAPIIADIADFVKTLAGKIAEKIKHADWSKAFAALNTVFLGGIFLTLKKALAGGIGLDFGGGAFAGLGKSLQKAVGGFAGGTLKNLSDSLGLLNGQLKTMQRNVQAKTLFAIAAAIGVLALGVLLLSTIDPKALTKAMTAVAVGLGQLVAAMALLSKFAKGGMMFTMPLIALSLIGIATGITILALAMKIFSTMSWGGIAKGLVGVGGGLAAVAVGTKFLSGPQMLLIGPALIGIGIGLNIMAEAMKAFAAMSWEDMVKGLVGAGYGLYIVGGALKMMGPETLLIGPGLIAVSFGLTMLAGAVATMGSLKVETLAKGITAIGAALLVIGLAIQAIPPTMALQAAGLLVMSIALTGIAGVMAMMGKLKMGTILKGLLAIGGALAVLAGGLTLMGGTLAGSVALLAAAAGLALLAPTLAFLGSLSWVTIIKGLVAIGAGLGTLAVMGLIAAPALTALGIAVTALGIGLLAVGAAVYLVGKGLSLISGEGAKGLGILIASITAFIVVIPKMLIGLVKGFVDVGVTIAKLMPQILVSLGTVLAGLLKLIVDNAPKVAVAVGSLIKAFLNVIAKNAGPILKAGFNLVLKFLSGIASNIGRVASKGFEIITRFLGALASKAGDLITGGMKVVGNFLGGIANNIWRVINSGAKVVAKFLEGVANKIPDLVKRAAHLVATFVTSVANNLGQVIKAGAHLVVKFITGIGNSAKPIVNSAVNTVIKWVEAIGNRKNIARIANSGVHLIVNFLEGIADAIKSKKNMDDMMNAGLDIAKAILEGIANNLGWLSRHLIKPIIHKVFGWLPGWAKDILGISSPSKVFAEIGANVMKGFAKGIIDSSPQVYVAMGDALRSVVMKTHDAKMLGSFLGHDFMGGLIGTVDNRSEAHKRIDDTFASLRQKLTEETDKLKDQISNDRQKLTDELGKDHPSETVVANLAADIRDNTALLRVARKATTDLMRDLQGEKGQLIALAASYDNVSARLEKAQQALADATQARNDAINSFRDQYNTLPDVGALLGDALAKAKMTADEVADAERQKQEDAEKQSQINQVALYEQAMQEKIKATEKYMATLEKLRQLGLDDATYKKLLSEGTADQSFADQLLQGGKRAVDDINKLDAQMLATSTKMATQAADDLYKAGIAAAQGLVDGLKEQKAELQNSMNELAGWLVAGIKNRLGIRSPSQVMAEVGKNTAQGVIQGLQMTSRSVADAAASVGDEAATAMTGSLSHISDLLGSEIDTDLTITPVLDLTQVRKDAATIGNLTSDATISAAASSGQASATSQEVSASKEAAAVAAAAAPTFTFEQNNYSPEALSDVEIYRQTKNQLSQVKSALGLPGLSR